MTLASDLTLPQTLVKTHFEHRRGSSEPAPRQVRSIDVEAAAERTFTTPEEAIEAAFATPRCALCLGL